MMQPPEVTVMVTPTAPTNSTEDREVAPLGILILIVLLCLCGSFGNGTIIWLLRFSTKNNPYSVYVFNLAVADFLFLFCMALSCVLNRTEFGSKSLEASEIFRRLTYFIYTLGLSLLATISIQRSLSVLFPIWYRCHHPKHLSPLVCAVLWILAILENLVAIHFCVIHKEKNSCQKVDLFFVVLIFGIFTPAICISGLVLISRVQKVSRKRQPAKLYVIILATILVFLICALPLGIHWFILYWLNLNKRLMGIYLNVAQISSCVNSTANPIIYFMVGRQRKKKFHEPLKIILERALLDEETTHAETVELGSESRGAQGSEDTTEQLPRGTNNYEDPQSVGQLQPVPTRPHRHFCGPPSICPNSSSEVSQL